MTELKKACLKLAAKMSRVGVKVANNTASSFWSYQPKAPKSVKTTKMK